IASSSFPCCCKVTASFNNSWGDCWVSPGRRDASTDASRMREAGRGRPARIWRSAPPGWLLLAFILDLDCVHRGVVDHRLKRQNQLSLGIRFQAMKGLRQGAEPAHLLINVEVLQKPHSVAVHVEDAVGGACVWGRLRSSPVGFSKMQSRRIGIPGVGGYSVAEIAVPFAGIEIGIRRSAHRIFVDRHLAAAIVGVRAPELSLLVRERGSLGHDANGNLAVRNAGKNLNGADNRLSSFADKLQVQLSIGTWVDIPEHALVGNIRSARVREDIEIVHEYAPVQLDQEGAAVFPAACTHSRSVNSFHEEQMKLIRAWFQGNVVGKLACADVLEEHRIVRAPDKL